MGFLNLEYDGRPLLLKFYYHQHISNKKQEPNDCFLQISLYFQNYGYIGIIFYLQICLGLRNFSFPYAMQCICSSGLITHLYFSYTCKSNCLQSVNRAFLFETIVQYNGLALQFEIKLAGHFRQKAVSAEKDALASCMSEHRQLFSLRIFFQLKFILCKGNQSLLYPTQQTTDQAIVFTLKLRNYRVTSK